LDRARRRGRLPRLSPRPTSPAHPTSQPKWDITIRPAFMV
jgi:hypothetical protein